MSSASNDQEWSDPSNWRIGVIYVARRDSRLFVPKRTHLGSTINFGHPLAWIPSLIVLILVFFAIRS